MQISVFARLHMFSSLDLRTAEDSSSLQYTHSPGLPGLCLCVCVSESPPITPLVQAMECDGSLKKNKAPHLPLSLICTWRAAVLYDKLAQPNAHSHKHNRVYTPTQNAPVAQPCSRGHCKQLKSICLCQFTATAQLLCSQTVFCQRCQ